MRTRRLFSYIVHQEHKNTQTENEVYDEKERGKNNGDLREQKWRTEETVQ